MGKLTPNTRRYKRKKFPFLMKYQTDAASEMISMTRLRDIGGGGLSFLTNDEIKEGSDIRIFILIPACYKPLEVKAHVLRVKLSGLRGLKQLVAVKFAEIAKQDKRVVDEFKRVVVTEYVVMPKEKEKKSPLINLVKLFWGKKGS